MYIQHTWNALTKWQEYFRGTSVLSMVGSPIVKVGDSPKGSEE